MLAICIGTTCAACSHTTSDTERQTIASAYAEIMITKNIYRHDSVRMVKAMDSVARSFGFDDRHDLMQNIVDLSDEPENLRKMLDSAQKLLERAQSGAEFRKDTSQKKK
ncbi:MAG TPA: hypothetical protein VHI13_13040 [Candidatus Kapabacteria bacterium]|nr:hypothetical protein [Candidatus Kapabacteria bacterium]